MYILIEDCGGQLLNCRSNIQTLWWKLMKAKATKKTIAEAFFCVTVAKLGHPGKHDSYMQADSSPPSSKYAEASMLRAGKLAP